jgi:hypothetical protein
VTTAIAIVTIVAAALAVVVAFAVGVALGNRSCSQLPGTWPPTGRHRRTHRKPV